MSQRLDRLVSLLDEASGGETVVTLLRQPAGLRATLKLAVDMGMDTRWRNTRRSSRGLQRRCWRAPSRCRRRRRAALGDEPPRSRVERRRRSQLMKSPAGHALVAVLDNEALQAVTDPGHSRHRSLMAVVAAAAQRNTAAPGRSGCSPPQRCGSRPGSADVSRGQHCWDACGLEMSF